MRITRNSVLVGFALAGSACSDGEPFKVTRSSDPPYVSPYAGTWVGTCWEGPQTEEWQPAPPIGGPGGIEAVLVVQSSGYANLYIDGYTCAISSLSYDETSLRMKFTERQWLFEAPPRPSVRGGWDWHLRVDLDHETRPNGEESLSGEMYTTYVENTGQWVSLLNPGFRGWYTGDALELTWMSDSEERPPAGY